MTTFAKILTLSATLAVIASPFALAEAGKKGDKPEKIAHGEQVEIKDYLVSGKITVFDFTSEYCPPCRKISPMLDELHARRADLVVVKVDINRPETKGIDWKSPVARQYSLQSVPHFKVYGADGKLTAEGDPAFEMVMGWIEQK
jgi:thiol-disulfide isomerase/thioredoxin